MLDLLIIGAGLAGLSAALTAVEAGLHVQIVAKGQGATHWHTGAFDLLGYLPGQAEPVHTPLRQLDALGPAHPYQRLGAQQLAASLAQFPHWLAETAFEYAGASVEGENLWLPSPLGARRPTYLAPASQRAGDLTRHEPMLIVGFEGLRDFFPTLIAENLVRSGQSARAVLLPLQTITHRRDFSTVQLAAGLDEAATGARLASTLEPLLRPGERVGLPAILGLHQHLLCWQELQTRLAAPVFEIPTLPPSVPGIRLYHALRDRLQRQGVRIEIGMEVIGFEAHGGELLTVQTATSARPRTHRARNFLLATGGILGGGFNSDPTGRCWEVIFDLPLTMAQERSRWFRHQFLHPEGQPLFREGVEVNASWQPVDGDGKVVYSNLWAAGGLLAHTDPIRERSLEGVAVATGIAAAQEIVER